MHLCRCNPQLLSLDWADALVRRQAGRRAARGQTALMQLFRAERLSEADLDASWFHTLFRIENDAESDGGWTQLMHLCSANANVLYQEHWFSNVLLDQADSVTVLGTTAASCLVKHLQRDVDFASPLFRCLWRPVSQNPARLLDVIASDAPVLLNRNSRFVHALIDAAAAQKNRVDFAFEQAAARGWAINLSSDIFLLLAAAASSLRGRTPDEFLGERRQAQLLLQRRFLSS